MELELNLRNECEECLWCDCNHLTQRWLQELPTRIWGMCRKMWSEKQVYDLLIPNNCWYSQIIDSCVLTQRVSESLGLQQCYSMNKLWKQWKVKKTALSHLFWLTVLVCVSAFAFPFQGCLWRLVAVATLKASHFPVATMFVPFPRVSLLSCWTLCDRAIIPRLSPGCCLLLLGGFPIVYRSSFVCSKSFIRVYLVTFGLFPRDF